MAGTLEQIPKAAAFLCAVSVNLWRLVLQLVERRDAHSRASTALTELKLQARALTRVLEQSVTTRHSASREEAEERCFGLLALLVAEAVVSSAPYLSSPSC